MIWNASGSAPAAWASSSMKDWKTKASALEPGARSGPVGTPSGIMLVSYFTLGTKRAGNSAADMPALGATAVPEPKVTKWSCSATRLPCASTPPFRKW